jgi:serine phosphatase RsbU (regulator of sigma subunit)
MRPEVTLVRFVAITVILAILVAGGFAGYFATQEIHRQKLTDTWAILFLDLERLGRDLAGDINAASIMSRPPVAILGDLGKATPKIISGDIPTNIDWRTLGIDTKADLSSSYLTIHAGNVFYVHSYMENSVALWPMDFAGLLDAKLEHNVPTVVYILSRTGALIYSNRGDITPDTAGSRPLVQAFIRRPIWQGQERISDANHKALYGFFQEITGTNMVLFAEVTEDDVLAPVRSAGKNFLGILIVIGFCAMIVIFFPLRAISRPMHELIAMANQVGQGNFQVAPVSGGFGEIKLLTDKFRDMTTNLQKRDIMIEQLSMEKIRKMRLEAELALAQNVQQNFLRRPMLPTNAGIELKSVYEPASEVAGDWFGYDYDPEHDMGLVAIADVSGHGAGSCMFTAVIAALFDTFLKQNRGEYNLEQFANQLNETMRELGRGSWHITLTMVKFNGRRKEFTILNAGHCFPLILGEKGTASPRILRMPSTPIGVSNELTTSVATVPATPGMEIFLYTDGLIEGLSPSGRAYGNKKLRLLSTAKQTRGLKLVDEVFRDWKEHLAGRPSNDDICLIGIKCV